MPTVLTFISTLTLIALLILTAGSVLMTGVIASLVGVSCDSFLREDRTANYHFDKNHALPTSRTIQSQSGALRARSILFAISRNASGIPPSS